MHPILCWAILASGVSVAAEPTPAPPDATIAAIVNGDVIRLTQVDELIRREFRPEVLTATQTHDIRQAVVEDLIDDLLVRQYLREHGPAVTPAEVDGQLRALMVSLRRQRRSLEEYFRETGRTEADVRDTWTNLLKFQKYVEGRTTEAELKKYYTLYKDLFDRVAVQVSQIVVRVPAGSPPGAWTAAQQQLAQVKADILSGKITFADAAKRYSVDPTATQGGALGWIARKDALVDEALARTAFALSVGAVSDPVQTPHGMVLIRVEARKPGQPTTFENVVDLVRECYTEDIRQQLVQQLRKNATIQTTIP
ncbi:MAG: peptidyl-prolyl cis-trans isomerase [Bacteroidales bacterium]|nr:peptidyl-prolyl cis-trans isomerase [Bacteroidales bacterium]